MTQLDPGLLAAIIADPDDDLPRLQMADWLDERGDEARAEFIRVQCEIARMDKQFAGKQFGHAGTHRHDGRPGQTIHGVLHVEDPRKPHHHCDDRCADPRSKLQDRERELLGHPNCEEWTRQVFPNPNGDFYIYGVQGTTVINHLAMRFQFSRGFISAIICTADNWLRHADAITAATPLERVTLTTMPDMAMGDRNDKLQLMGHKSKAWHRIPLSGRSRVGAAEESTEVRLLKRYWPRIKFVVLSYQPGPILARVATIGSFPLRDTGRLRSSIGPTI